MPTKLFLYGRDQRTAAPPIAAIWKVPVKQQKEANNLAELSKEINRHKKLDELVLDFHGYPGGLILDDGGFTLSDQKVSRSFANTAAKIEHIRFEGCWVGEAPDEMATFGRLFSAQYVSGFTWTCWTSEIEVTIPKGITAKALKDFLKLFEMWLMPGTPPIAQLASMARRREIIKKLPMMWYQYSLEEKPPFVDGNYQKYGKHKYKTRSEVKTRTVEAKDAKRSKDPTPPFEYVTVKLR